MLHERLAEFKALSGKSTRQISAETRIPESTLKRILSGDTPDPYVSTIHKIADAIGVSMDVLLSDTNAVISSQRLAEAIKEAEEARAQRDDALAENAVLKAQVTALATEMDFLRIHLAHKEELLAVHDYYMRKRDAL